MLHRSNDAARSAFSWIQKETAMPRAKNDNRAGLDADAENGFAALEAKVEEMQVEAAIEAEFAAGDVIAAAPASLPQTAQATAPRSGPADEMMRVTASLGAPAPAVPLKTVFSAFEDWAQSAVQFQADTIASFAGVRGPQDLLTAQMAYGARALEFYLATVNRIGQASPALWATLPGLQSSPSR